MYCEKVQIFARDLGPTFKSSVHFIPVSVSSVATYKYVFVYFLFLSSISCGRQAHWLLLSDKCMLGVSHETEWQPFKRHPAYICVPLSE